MREYHFCGVAIATEVKEFETEQEAVLYGFELLKAAYTVEIYQASKPWLVLVDNSSHSGPAS